MENKYQLQGQSGRLDKVLGDLIIDESRSTIQKWIKSGLVSVDGQVAKANHKLQGHELVSVQFEEGAHLEPALPIDLVPQAMDLDIVYEDDHLLVINKPAGMVVHPSKGHSEGTLVNGLLYYLGDSLAQDPQNLRPGLVHRIDKDTSGLLVVAKHNQAHQALASQLEDHSMGRTYIALVNGLVKENQGTIEVPLKRDPANRLRWTGDKTGKQAITHFQVLTRYKDSTLLSLQLETGRTHQIRVHMEFIGHPIVGDPVYRKGLNSTKSSLGHFHEGQFLHAQELHFKHPVSGEDLSFSCPLPEKFLKLLDDIAEED